MPAAGRGQRGAVHEWVEQQQLLQRAGAWEACAISVEAANRDLEARLSRANEDRRAADSPTESPALDVPEVLLALSLRQRK